MERKMALYRGSLKSCNYHCSYCPFSKRRTSEKELVKDQGQWEHFVETFLQKAETVGICALMVVPYGEALLHSWYWEGLGRLSASPAIDAVGAQTNLSFSVEPSFSHYEEAGGQLRKLKLWATFHPEMTTVEAFAEKCRRISEKGVALCAGAVGVPKNLELIRRLRGELPEKIYLWINQMDGLGRKYTEDEKKEFLKIDPYFERELLPVTGDVSRCGGRLFVEGDGKVRACNISAAAEKSWDALMPEAKKELFVPKCSRKLCSCYLAYGGRDDFMNQVLFGPYPLFRIPRRPRAVFLDVEGTLILKKQEDMPSPKVSGTENIEDTVRAGLHALVREHALLFFATTLPYEDAMRRCRSVRHLFSGGVFSGGAHMLLEQDGKGREQFHFLDEACLEGLEQWKEMFRYRILVCRKEGRLYKITLLRSLHMPWGIEEAEKLAKLLPAFQDGTVRYFIEDRCFQIVSAGATKAEGVRTLCRWLDIPLKETIAAGDSKEDAEMLRLCGNACKCEEN